MSSDRPINQSLDTTFRRPLGRNDLCPCGSGRKYKRCCLPLGRLVRHVSGQSIVEAACERALAKRKKRELAEGMQKTREAVARVANGISREIARDD